MNLERERKDVSKHTCLHTWNGVHDTINGSIDLEGVHDTENMFDFSSEPGCWIAQISAERRGAATEDEVGARVHVFFHCLWV